MCSRLREDQIRFSMCLRVYPPSDWPDGLEQIFLPAEKVLSMTLTVDRPLAAQPAARVMEEIAAKGYFLQLPPQPLAPADITEPAPC